MEKIHSGNLQLSGKKLIYTEQPKEFLNEYF
jgi:hypothetical protein